MVWRGLFFFNFQGLACLKQLKCLRLAWNKGVTDEVVEKVCGSIKGLKELDLSLCRKITCRSLQVGVRYGHMYRVDSYGTEIYGMVCMAVHGMVTFRAVWHCVV